MLCVSKYLQVICERIAKISKFSLKKIFSLFSEVICFFETMNLCIIQNRALRFLYSDYESDYKTLLTKAGKTTMNVYRLIVLCNKIYKSLNSFSPIKDFFKPNTSNISLCAQQQDNLKTPSPNQTTSGTKLAKYLVTIFIMRV